MSKKSFIIIILIAGYLIFPARPNAAGGYEAQLRFFQAYDTIPAADTTVVTEPVTETDTIPENGTPPESIAAPATDTIPASDTTVVTEPVTETDTIPENGTPPESIAAPATDTIPAADTTVVTEPVTETDTIPAAEPVMETPEPKPSYWKKGGQTAFSFSQISLSNWSAGGQNSVSFSSYFNVFMNYTTPDENLNWENTLDLGYGLINQEQRGTVKSDDKIDFSSKFGIRASETWSYSSLLSFRTQFASGYKSPGDTVKISNFLAPGYINLSIGMNHKFDDNINFYLSPLAGKITLVYDEELSGAGLFGVEPGENTRYEFGGFVRIQFRATLIENITVNSRLELFSNYLENPKNFDVNSDTRINMQINRYFSANLVIQMLYDENVRTRIDSTGDGILDTTIGPRLQVKQVFGIGLSYRF